jgi:hypothetical protein
VEGARGLNGIEILAGKVPNETRLNDTLKESDHTFELDLGI